MQEYWDFSDYQYSSFAFYFNWNAGEILYIKDFKIEEGNKATDWTITAKQKGYERDRLEKTRIN